MSYRALKDNSHKGYSSDYGVNGSTECDVLASDTKSGSRSKSNSPPPEPPSSLSKERIWTVAACALIACLASLVNVGMMLGFSSPALKQLQFNVSEEFQITNTDVKFSLFGSLGPIGATFGGLVAWPLSDLLGRKLALIFSGIPSSVGWLFIALAHFAHHPSAFYGILLTGRALTGFSTGWSIFCVSVYISEIASAKLKGLFGNCNQLFVTIGIFLSYFFGIEYKQSDGNYASLKYWQIALIAVGLVAVFEILMLFTYETPRWLLSKRKDRKAIQVLAGLRGPNCLISKEIEQIRASLQRTYSVLDQLMEFRHRSIIIPFLLVLMLMFFQQFSGINVAIFYASLIFQEAGLSERQVDLIVATAIGVVQVFATLLSVVLVDCLGRKVLLTLSSIVMALSSLVLGGYFYVYNNVCDGCFVGELDCNISIINDTVHEHFPCNSTSFGYLAVVCIIVFIIGFSLGWGPIPWTSMSELMPNRVRSLAGSIATFVNWTFAFVITFCFKFYSRPPIDNDGAWWTFPLIMFSAIFMVILFLPETNGHSLEEIQEHFEEGHIFALTCHTSSKTRSKPSYSSIERNSEGS